MQDGLFRQWLEARGLTPKGINTRVSAVRQVEQKLEALGSAARDLDRAYDNDQLQNVRELIGDLRQDALAGGDRFRILMPDSIKPYGRLQNVRSWVGQYAQFRSGAEARTPAETPAGENEYWLLGAAFGGKDDQVDRFLAEGIWEIGRPSEKEASLVQSMTIGDRIVLKSAFVQKNKLPFENRQNYVSVMRLKARGTVIENPDDGHRVKVSWEPEFEQRDWYFYTYRATIWRLRPGEEFSDRLINFAFFDEVQDLDWFRNHGSWKDLYGDNVDTKRRYWLEKTIVSGRHDRQEGEHALGRALWSPQKSKDGRRIYKSMLDVRPGDVVYHLTDNEAISGVSVALEVADPTFEGLSETEWAGQEAYRIELGEYQELRPPLPRHAFLDTEPYSVQLRELAESGARGLFYNSARGLNQGAYLTELTPTLLDILGRAYTAYTGEALPYLDEPRLDHASQPLLDMTRPYSLGDALEGWIIDDAEAGRILALWRAKKNLIIQGPPGVGKSFASQKLAFALMGEEARDRFRFVQFHQSYAYEDFVEGYRPTADGFELKPGKFVEFCRQAEADPNRQYVFVIDEINRGNISKILGELMLLIESDKRDRNWAVQLASGTVPFHVPDNVYILGLMNTADRSLAVVDYALRRRFAFVELHPQFGSPKFLELLSTNGISGEVGSFLRTAIAKLNEEIISDPGLGAGFAIGHSYFSSRRNDAEDSRSWYERIIETEIGPLLHEYWFDDREKADQRISQLKIEG